jgi:Tol biopolymer transport system component
MASPDSLIEAIVYTTLRPPNFDVFLFEGPGAAPRRLTHDDAMDYNAVFSPDGRWVVFTSERNGSADLFALDLEGTSSAVRLTSHMAMDDAAAFAPDGRKLAFVSTRDGDADVFVMPFGPGDATAEGRAVNLTQRPGGDFNPAFSPDGRRIAYSRQDELWFRAQRGEERPVLGAHAAGLYVMNADGTDVRRVSEPGPGFLVGGQFEFGRVAGSPAWSRDGAALYYYLLGPEGSEIRRVGVDGSGDARVTLSGLSPAVLRDGRVAFSRPQPPPEMDEFDAFRTGRIFSVAADGSDLRLESDAARSYFAPDFDRESGRMVCHGPGRVDGLPVITGPGFEALGGGFAFAPPGAHARIELSDRTLEVIGIRGYFPALLPSGEVVSTPLHRPGPRVPLEISSLDGGALRALFTPESGVAWGAAVARDAGWLVAAVGPPFAPGEASVDLWKVRLDGSEATNLTAEIAANDALPHASADGRRIVFRSGGDGGGSVYGMDDRGRERRRLTDVAAIETMPALSPDGEWVVFSTHRAGGFKL